jgi:hypothetical protein
MRMSGVFMETGVGFGLAEDMEGGGIANVRAWSMSIGVS